MSASARARPGAVDPRLLQYARATRPFLVALVVLGGITALLIIAQAWLLAYVIAAALGRGHGSRAGSPSRWPPCWAWFWVAPLSPGDGSCWPIAPARAPRLSCERRCSSISEHSDPSTSSEQRAGELAVLATRGIDALDGYFSLYLPQLFLAVIVPAAVLVASATRTGSRL